MPKKRQTRKKRKRKGRGRRIMPLTRRWITALAVILPLVFLNHLLFTRDYYERLTKVNYRAVVQAVLTEDPSGDAPVLGSRSSHYYDYYFARLGSDRRIDLAVLTADDQQRVENYLEENAQASFWLLQGRLFPPEPGLQAFFDDAFEVVEQVEANQAKATLYRRRAQASEQRRR